MSRRGLDNGPVSTTNSSRPTRPLLQILLLVWLSMTTAFIIPPTTCTLPYAQQLDRRRGMTPVRDEQMVRYNGGRTSGSRVVVVRKSAATAEAVALAPEQEDKSTVSTNAEVRVVCLVPGGGRMSPLKASWVEVMEHMHRRMQFVDPNFSLRVLTHEEVAQQGRDALPDPSQVDIFYALHIQDGALAGGVVKDYAATVRNAVCLNCTAILDKSSHLGSWRPTSRANSFWRLIPFDLTKRKAKMDLFNTVRGFWDRGHSDDLLYMILVVINAMVLPIPSVSEILKPVTLKAVSCMVCNCAKQIIDCQKNPVCKGALACLENCAPNDQVCRYRCIVSYETPEFEQFALCILQKHNCLNNHAIMPRQPDPDPMATFRGEPLTHDMAEQICFGFLSDRPWSWKVVAGQNPAYDFFPVSITSPRFSRIVAYPSLPCRFGSYRYWNARYDPVLHCPLYEFAALLKHQHQLFYKKGKAMWYDPVFSVIKYDGTPVWRRRHYRVRKAKVPGTFWFSVLDNGVTSAEYWRIVDAADDLSWVLFYYTGAAAAAGQSYSGAIYCTPDGQWPSDEAYLPRLTEALDRAGIKIWELFRVAHDPEVSKEAPLGLDVVNNQEVVEAMAS